MKKSTRKSIAGLLCGAVLLGVLAGCGGKDPAGQGGNSKITMMNIYFSAEPPKEDDPVIQEIEKYTKKDLDIVWVPSAAYGDKVAVTIASGEMPKVIMVSDPTNQAIINGEQSGMFWDITPYLKDYPNLSTKMDENVVKSLKVDGKLYGIYRSRPIARDTLIYRKDWLDKLGMQEPKTVDEVYEMLKAFAKNDPDGNGQDDTMGLVDMKGIPYCVLVAAWYGAPTSWSEDGTPSFMTEGYLDMMKWYRKLYEENIINRDFGVTEEAQVQQIFLSGKAGAKFHVWDALLRDEETELKKIDPDAELTGVSLIQGPDGQTHVRSWSGYGGMFMFPKSSVKTEEELKSILEYFDKMYDLPMQNLLKHGVEGADYKVENGKAIKIKEKIDETTFSVMDQMYLNYDEAMPSGNLTAGGEKAVEMMKESKQYVVYNPFAGLISKTNNEKGPQLQKIIDDAKIKFVMGALDEAGWKSEIERWKTSGGSQIMEELRAAYEQSK